MIFLDEPTTGLDPRTRGQMWDTIRELVADGCTVLLTTQYLDEADQLADRVAVIDRGRKVAQGTPDELKGQVDAPHLVDDTALTEGPAVGSTTAARRAWVRPPCTGMPHQETSPRSRSSPASGSRSSVRGCDIPQPRRRPPRCRAASGVRCGEGHAASP